jgi:type VI secretion system Hcp family effector
MPGDGPAGAIECIRFELGLAAKLDAAGHPTGGRRYDPLLVTKRLDGASPRLTQALLANETVQGSFKFFRQDAGARQHFYTVKITGARVIGCREVLPDTLAPSSAGRPPLEELEFVFDQVEWTFEPGGVTTQDTGILGP